MRNPTALGSLTPTPQITGSRAIETPSAYWPSKSSTRIQKPFRMISLRKIRQQLPWIDILTKNTGGWGYIPFSNPTIPANAAALGAGSKPTADIHVLCPRYANDIMLHTGRFTPEPIIPMDGDFRIGRW